jgi:hypothetical protein
MALQEQTDLYRCFSAGGTDFQPGRPSLWRDEAPVVADGALLDQTTRLLQELAYAQDDTVCLLTTNDPAGHLKDIEMVLQRALALTVDIRTRVGTATLKETD